MVSKAEHARRTIAKIEAKLTESPHPPNQQELEECLACWRQYLAGHCPQKLGIVVIVCANHVAAGNVIMLLLQEGFLPISHFRLSQVNDDLNQVTITFTSALSAPYETDLRAKVAVIPNTSIQ